MTGVGGLAVVVDCLRGMMTLVTGRGVPPPDALIKLATVLDGGNLLRKGVGEGLGSFENGRGFFGRLCFGPEIKLKHDITYIYAYVTAYVLKY